MLRARGREGRRQRRRRVARRSGHRRRSRRCRCARRSRRSAARPSPTTTPSAISTAPANIVQTAVDAFGTVDILVNNAGIVRDRSLLKMEESDFDAVDRRPPQGHVQLHTSRGAGHEGEGLRPHRQHHVVGGPARQLRPDQLRRGQGRDHGHDVRVGAGARQVRHHGERGRAVGRDADDRGAVREVRHGAAARGEPRAQRAVGRVRRVRGGRAT